MAQSRMVLSEPEETFSSINSTKQNHQQSTSGNKVEAALMWLPLYVGGTAGNSSQLQSADSFVVSHISPGNGTEFEVFPLHPPHPVTYRSHPPGSCCSDCHLERR